MTDLLDLAARLEAACDITGKPIGRHMVDATKTMSEVFGQDGDREGQDMATVTGTLSACIDAEAKLFDALAVVAKEAVAALRAVAKPLDMKGLADMLGTSEEDVMFTTTFHQAYDMGAKAHTSYSAGYVDAERDIMEYLDDAGAVDFREDISRCEHRPQAVSDLLCLRTKDVPPRSFPHQPTPEMIAAAWDVIDKAKLRGGLKRLGPGVGVVEIWQAMAAAAPGADGIAFECKAYDAHCPSMTVRFQVPTGFPLAGGIFRIQRVRTATTEDTASFAHLPDAPETL